jgi:hypothetical protein
MERPVIGREFMNARATNLINSSSIRRYILIKYLRSRSKEYMYD